MAHNPEVRPGRYLHVKGKFYDVVGVARYKIDDREISRLGVAKHSETLEEYVIFECLNIVPRRKELCFKPVSAKEDGASSGYLDCEEDDVVVYWSLDDALQKKELWVRPKKMFLENVIKDGKEVLRFRYIGDAK